jgi:hypothetical protein
MAAIMSHVAVGRNFALAIAIVAGTDLWSQRPPAAQGNSPEGRAVAYLRAEVPRWRREHPCYSCHNNGDAARALLAASAAGLDIGDALDDTLAWLSAPERWEQNGSRGGSSDLPLARVQFASALDAAVTAGRASGAARDRAVGLMVTHQQADGSWTLNPSQTLGGATFYGRALATAMARNALGSAGTASARPARDRADAWLRETPPANVLDAASMMLGLGGAADSPARTQRERALGLVRDGEASGGGWGPYVTSQPEIFDTALTVLALSRAREMPDAARRGRAYLLEQQQDDGSWVETTRPAGGESYAQRISTTAWALLALLASR